MTLRTRTPSFKPLAVFKSLDTLQEDPFHEEALYSLLSQIPYTTLEFIKNGPPPELFMKYLKLKIEAKTRFTSPAFWRKMQYLRDEETEYCKICPTIGHGNDSCDNHYEKQTLSLFFEMPVFNEDGSVKNIVSIDRYFSYENFDTIYDFLTTSPMETPAQKNAFVNLIENLEDRDLDDD